MTYSVSEVFEPVAGEDKKRKEKKETRLRKTVQEKKYSLQHRTRTFKVLTLLLREYCRQTSLPGGVLYRLRCLH